MTLAEIGTILGVRAQYVFQIEQRALAKLRGDPDAADLVAALDLRRLQRRRPRGRPGAPSAVRSE